MSRDAIAAMQAVIDYNKAFPGLPGETVEGLRRAVRALAAPREAVPQDATPEMIVAAMKVDFDNENEEATLHNIWHAFRSALAPDMAARREERELVEAQENDKCSREFLAIADKRVEELEAQIKRLTANKIGFTHEPTGKRVTIYAMDADCFDILAECPEVLKIAASARKLSALEREEGRD